MAHGIIRTDKMSGTTDGSKLYSVKYKVSNVDAAIDNGCVVLLGALDPNNREVFIGGTPTATSAISDIVVIATPEVMYDERLKNLDEFFNEASKLARGYAVEPGDIFSVTKEVLDGVANPAVGNIVELKAGTKMNIASTLTAGSTKVGTIIAVDIVGNDTYYVIKVA